MSAYQKLSKIFERLSDLDHMDRMLSWDESVMMPPGGGPSRAKALGTLKAIQYETLSQPEIHTLVSEAESEAHDDPWKERNFYWMKKRVQNTTALPKELVTETAEHNILCQQAWRTCRDENDWARFQPLLEKSVGLTKQAAEIRSQATGVAPLDILIDDFSPDVNMALIDPIFNQLKSTLPELIQRIQAKQEACEPAATPQGPFSVEKQRELGLALMKDIGFDFNHGRLDTSHHPFCGGTADDVRITTFYHENDCTFASMATCHEAGHACYEQGLPQKWRSQPVGLAPGMSLHESQSLLIEMQATRSPEFLKRLSHLMKTHLGDQSAFEPENLRRHISHVTPSFIRVAADEVTYPLHVIMRYELEKSLFDGTLAVADLPAAWDEKLHQFLGLNAGDNHRNGVLQDVHWSCGAFGYFPAYTLGRLIAAQLYAHALKASPQIPGELGQGNFKTLLHWLRENIHQYGSLHPMQTLLKNATGEPLNPDYFIQHIEERYL